MTEERTKRKLSAILSADVKGYSRLMGADEAATVQTLKAYREVMTSFIQQHRGRVVDSPGDNLLAEFGSVVDALDCAVKIQRELKAKNSELPEKSRMEYRIGVNLGDVIEDEERIYGDGVNVAARVEGLADGGGICVSGTAYDQIVKKLPLGFEYLGEQPMKNIEKPVRVYRVLMEPEAAGKVIGELKPKTKQLRGVAIGAVAVLIIVAGVLAIWNFYFRPPFEPASVEKMAFPLPDKPSIAVMPFANMTGDQAQEFFCDGLAEEIITALSKVPQLFVIARDSTFSYKGKPMKVQQISEELEVQYVLEGSIRESGDRVRIAAQLIDALKGHHLWAERYDRNPEDVLTVQDEITKKIITALQVRLTEGEQARIYSRGTDNLQAYMKAMEAWWYQMVTTKESVLRARQLAEEAITLDPNYAFPYTVLGGTHGAAVWLGMSKSPRESLKRCIELHKKAITLDNTLAIGYAGLGYWLVIARQYDQAIAAGERAMTLAPNSADVLHLHASVLTFAGKREEAIQLFRQALRLNPVPPNSHLRHFGIALRDSGRYEEAIVLQKKALEQDPNDFFAYLVLTSSCSLAGRDTEARAAAQEVLRINPRVSVARIQKVSPHKDRAVAKRWCDALREAGLPD